jgi:hypothetical protein
VKGMIVFVNDFIGVDKIVKIIYRITGDGSITKIEG